MGLVIAELIYGIRRITQYTVTELSNRDLGKLEFSLFVVAESTTKPPGADTGYRE